MREAGTKAHAFGGQTRWPHLASLTPVLMAATLAAPRPAAAAIPAAERAALVALYNSTNGVSWTNRTNWRNPGNTDFNAVGTECSWFGVTCGSDRVVVLDLRANQLTGVLPNELGNLSQLIALYLFANRLTGSLPAQLANLSNLQVIQLNSNQLGGGLPPFLGGLRKLTSLSLSSNQFAGGIPPELGSLTELINLNLSFNQLTGAIPSQLGNLTNLNTLSLAGNQLTGALPATLGNLRSLTGLYLYSNQVTGPIPPEWGGMTALQWLDLRENRLGGRIPGALGALTNLRSLLLTNNQLTGGIPSALGNLTRLEELLLERNHLEGGIPPQLGSLSSLTALAVHDNRLEGAVPAALGNLTRLQRLSVCCNRLVGDLPPTLTNLAALTSLSLLDNALYATDSTLRAFLTALSLNWQAFQTVAVTGLSAGTATQTGVTLSWTPIVYNYNPGGYRVFGATRPGGPYSLLATTASQTASSQVITGLSPDTPYYFSLQTVKEASPPQNQNTVLSEPSLEVATRTLVAPGSRRRLTVSISGNGEGVVRSLPTGIACGGLCEGTFAQGVAVVLTAIPSPGSILAAWEGDCSGVNVECDLTMGDDRVVRVAFVKAPGFYSIVPCRAFDSRDFDLGGPHPLAAGTTVPVSLADHCVVPPTAKAVALNVTVTASTAPGFLTIYPDGRSLPLVSVTNYGPGQTRANNAVIPLGASGAVDVFVGQAAGTVHVLLDVFGYFE